MLRVVRYLVTAAGIRLPGAISLDGTQFFHIGYGWEGSQAIPVAGALHVLAFVSPITHYLVHTKATFKKINDQCYIATLLLYCS
jgi:hypothetical protein